MTEHPRDSRGRILPEPSWPAGRAAPGGLERVRRFCNTTNRENGADRFAEPGGLGSWLAIEHLPAVDATPAEHARIVAFREHLHGFAAAHTSGTPHDTDGLSGLLAAIPFVVTAVADGLRIEVTATGGVDRLLGGLAVAVVDAQHRGTWRRLKACAQCGWVVYDGSRNRSARWCSMSACGGREHARAYRRRRAAPSSG
ncbi:MAG: CGNR zinc finger domain-containing protein [Pseudonocardia sp.]|nr:CGNR zinc finger domain-containing protein [Pseudonocardia sp.]